MLIPQFDACASWWTQGPDSNLQVLSSQIWICVLFHIFLFLLQELPFTLFIGKVVYFNF